MPGTIVSAMRDNPAATVKPAKREDPEFERLKAILLDATRRIGAGEDPDEVKEDAHELFDPCGD